MKTKDELIKEYLSQPIKIGDIVEVRGLGSQDKSKWFNSTRVLKVLENDSIAIQEYGYNTLTIVEKDNYRKYIGSVGYNPNTNIESPQSVAYTLDSIIHKLFKGDNENYTTKNGLPIKETNFNPYVIIDGVKKYYQRDFCWTIEQCQNLIESIYNKIDIGKCLIRVRSYSTIEKMALTGEKELFFSDVVDGKQRLTAIWKFVNNEYPDKNGYYWRDFSDIAQHNFLNNQLLSFSTIECSDKAILRQFLLLNFAGVPQSQEHLDYVKSLIK